MSMDENIQRILSIKTAEQQMLDELRSIKDLLAGYIQSKNQPSMSMHVKQEDFKKAEEAFASNAEERRYKAHQQAKGKK